MRRAWQRKGTTLNGPLRFSPRRDLLPVIGLVRQEFAAEMDEEDRRWLADLEAAARFRPLLVVLDYLPLAWAGFHGFVWFDAGRLVGKASLLRRGADNWFLANVVTHPNWRRRGIARQLVGAAVDWARRRGLSRLELEVRSDNEPAQKLYRSLGFERLYAVRRLSLASAQELGPATAPTRESGILVRRWLPSDSRAVRQVLMAAGIREAKDAAGPLIAAFRLGGACLDAAAPLALGRPVGLVAVGDGVARAVLVTNIALRGGTHHLELACDPAWRGIVEPALLAEALRGLAKAPDGRLEIRLRTDEEPAYEWLLAHGFETIRTMDRLAIYLRSASEKS